MQAASPSDPNAPGLAVIIVPVDEDPGAKDGVARDVNASRWLLRVIFVAVICGLCAYYLLPGAFDPASGSVFTSGQRRSPLLAWIGPVELLNRAYDVESGDVLRFDFPVDVPSFITVEVSWMSGPPVEVFVTRVEEYEEFRATFAQGEGHVRHYAQLASTPGPSQPSFSGQVTLGPGSYTIIVEHTPNGALRPPEADARARGRVRVEAS